MASETKTISGDVKPRANTFTTKTNIAVVESENSEMRKENLREKDRPVLFQKSNLSEMSSTHGKVQSNNLDNNDISNSEPFNSPEIQSLNEDAKGKLCWNLNNNTDVPISVDVGEYFETVLPKQLELDFSKENWDLLKRGITVGKHTRLSLPREWVVDVEEVFKKSRSFLAVFLLSGITYIPRKINQIFLGFVSVVSFQVV